jgi:hypothetical protein
MRYTVIVPKMERIELKVLKTEWDGVRGIIEKSDFKPENLEVVPKQG